MLQSVIATVTILSAQGPPHKAATSPTASRSIVASIPNADDIESLVRQLSRLGARGEFETTEQFQARQAKIVQTGRKYAFALDREPLELKYDADEGIMWASVSLERRMFAPEYNYAYCIQMRRILRHSERHVGVNSFGVRAAFEARLYEDYGAVVSQASVFWLRTFSFDCPKSGLTADMERSLLVKAEPQFWARFPLQLPADRAKDLKPDLRMMLVGTVPDVRVYLDSSFDGATVSNPSEITIKKRFVNFLVSAVRIIDAKDGRTLAEFTAN